MISKAIKNLSHVPVKSSSGSVGYPRIRIDYCGSWGYVNQIAPCKHMILQRYSNSTFETNVIPGRTGCFEVFAEGQLVHSKLKTGKFIEDPDDFMERLDEVLASKK